MKISDRGITLIKSFESCKLSAYRCPAGIATIGWGSTKGVKMDMKISQYVADEMFRRDLAEFENAVARSVTSPLNQNQFDALVSFFYNCGIAATTSSTLLKKLNNSDYAGASQEFLRWNKADGKVLKGLTRRREAERKLFIS